MSIYEDKSRSYSLIAIAVAAILSATNGREQKKVQPEGTSPPARIIAEELAEPVPEANKEEAKPREENLSIN